ncbi:hypothetical protein [Streptomyces anulatus]
MPNGAIHLRQLGVEGTLALERWRVLDGGQTLVKALAPQRPA